MKNIVKIGLLLNALMAPTGLRAMEMASFIDRDGKEVYLNQVQEEVFSACDTVASAKHFFSKEFKNDQYSHKNCITFAGISAPPFLNGTTIISLLNVIRNENEFGIKNMLASKDEDELIELFKVGDYLSIPKKQLTAIADCAYQPLKNKIAVCKQELAEAENNKGWISSFWAKQIDPEISQKRLQLNELKLLRQNLKEHLSYCPNVSVFLRNNWKCEMISTRITQEGKDIENKLLRFINHDPIENRKKLRLLKGIEKLIQQNPSMRNIRWLDLVDQQLQNIDIKKLRQIFPNLKMINISHNNVNRIDPDDIDHEIICLYAQNNDIQSIYLENPSNFNKAIIDVTNNPVTLANIQFKETNIQKVLTWLKALAAQGRIVLVPTQSDLRCMLMMVPVHFISGYLMFSLHYIKKLPFTKTEFVRLLKKVTLVIVMSTPNIYFFVQMFKIMDGALSNQLRTAAQNNPYAISVTTDTGDKYFPSPYTYKLFGKNN